VAVVYFGGAEAALDLKIRLVSGIFDQSDQGCFGGVGGILTVSISDSDFDIPGLILNDQGYRSPSLNV
jgi:hypothetical protein